EDTTTCSGAKNNHCPTSTATGTPWISISQTEAIATCAALGNGAHLITNAEWTLLARNIESVPANWTGGSVGSGILKRGNVGMVDAGSYDGADPDTGISNNLAELVLSNGQSIWHLSGNVWEWNNNVFSSGTGVGFWQQGPGWIEWNNGNLADYEKSMAGSIGNYTSTNGVGQYYGVNGGAVQRGGDWADGLLAGVFSLNLYSSSAGSDGHLGFRCAR
ncbi:MAG: SUMF1/EgtB/PvdO family nonheme iron enzyme, partial [Candidatus Paceibacterota bacterium]